MVDVVGKSGPNVSLVDENRRCRCTTWGIGPIRDRGERLFPPVRGCRPSRNGTTLHSSSTGPSS
ncbi:hypothetical protein NY08_2217 [Rhodococcus sp. B7740]|nr:hypothetical protein NY08_2217 [Rhodococcus sp. B7740]